MWGPNYYEYLTSRSAVSLAVRRVFFKDILRHLHGRVLDVGCGIGEFLQLDRNAVGIDVNPWLVKLNADKGHNSCLASATLLPFGAESFDGLLASNLPEHLSDPERVFAEAQRVLVTGGVFVLTVPLDAGYYHDATHVTFIRETHVRDWAERHGLAVREAYIFPVPWKRIASLLYFCELRIVLCKVKSGT